MIFVCSMSDLFHQGVPFEFILSVFEVMGMAPQHRFQVLTKRAKRLVDLGRKLPWVDNIWAGVSVENSEYLYRIDHLKQTDAAVKFISFEPLLGPINDMDLQGIDWVIVGGESGPGARPIEKAWVKRIRDICVANSVPFFFKQWGGVQKKRTGRLLDGKLWDQIPETIQCV
jgi:protein gp37